LRRGIPIHWFSGQCAKERWRPLQPLTTING